MKRCASSTAKPFRFAQHLERLARGADFLKIKCPFTPRELEKFAGQLIEKNKMPEAILRLTLTRGPGGRGYTPNSEGKPTVVMTLHPAPPLENPVEWNLVTSSFRISAADPLASFKTTSKILHVMARAEAVERGADEALLLNTNGEVAETASGNFFWVHDDTICTVPTGAARCRASRGRSCWKSARRWAGDKRARHQAGGIAQCRGHFRHAKRVRHRAGGGVRRQTGRAIAAGGPNRARLPRNAGSAVT